MVTVEIVQPTRQEAQELYDRMARAVGDVDGARLLKGYRRIEVGDLSISVKAQRDVRS